MTMTLFARARGDFPQKDLDQEYKRRRDITTEHCEVLKHPNTSQSRQGVYDPILNYSLIMSVFAFKYDCYAAQRFPRQVCYAARGLGFSIPFMEALGNIWLSEN